MRDRMASSSISESPSQLVHGVLWDNIPPELVSRKIWCLWSAILGDGGKIKKVPRRQDGMGAMSWADPLSFSTVAGLQPHYLAGISLPTQSGKHFAGIGIIIPEKGDLKAFDLDDAVDENGQIKPAAKAILDRINSYSEASLSGKGFHGIAFASLTEDNENLGEARNEPLRIDGQRIEFYARSHFLTFTGRRLTGYSDHIDTRQNEMRSLYEGLEDIRDFARATTKKTARVEQSDKTPDDERLEIYCHRALESEAQEVGGASEGARNNSLNNAALKMGRYVGAEFLSRSEVERSLLSSARMAELPEAEARATIKSGLGAGISDPKRPVLEDNPGQLPTTPCLTVCDVIRTLSAVCDGAIDRDGMGFSKYDLESRKDLIDKALVGDLSKEQQVKMPVLLQVSTFGQVVGPR
jgi:hypothetical protein